MRDVSSELAEIAGRDYIDASVDTVIQYIDQFFIESADFLDNFEGYEKAQRQIVPIDRRVKKRIRRVNKLDVVQPLVETELALSRTNMMLGDAQRFFDRYYRPAALEVRHSIAQFNRWILKATLWLEGLDGEPSGAQTPVP